MNEDKREIMKALEEIEEICYKYNTDENVAILNVVYAIVHKCELGFHFHNDEIEKLISDEELEIEIGNRAYRELKTKI